jgi:hypothetical protein
MKEQVRSKSTVPVFVAARFIVCDKMAAFGTLT